MTRETTRLKTLWYMGAKTRLCEEFLEVIGTADVEAVMLVPSNDYEELSEGPQEEQG